MFLVDVAVSTKDYVNEKLSSLQDAIQCSLAQLNKDNVSGKKKDIHRA